MHNIKHILNVATGIDIVREDKDIIEKKVELADFSVKKSKNWQIYTA